MDINLTRAKFDELTYSLVDARFSLRDAWMEQGCWLENRSDPAVQAKQPTN